MTDPSLAAQICREIEARYPYASCDDCFADFVVAPLNEVVAAALVVAREAGE